MQMMWRWGEILYEQGYVNYLGLRVIIDPPEGNWEGEQIDPSNRGTLVRPPRLTQAFGDSDTPYNINFLIELPFGYVLTPNAPPSD